MRYEGAWDGSTDAYGIPCATYVSVQVRRAVYQTKRYFPVSIPERVKNKMKEEGLKGVNKPKRTPNHPTKSHCVMAKEGDTYKFIRFGQQGVKGAGKSPKTAKDKARKKSYYARHDAQGKPTSKLSAKYWSHKVKW